MGGDPLFSKNIDFTRELLELTKNEFDICLYTGESVEFVKKYNIRNFKYLKCGWYNENLKQESLKTNTYFQLASTNQCLYDSNYNILSKNGRYYYENV